MIRTPLQILSQNCWTKSTWSTQTAAMGRRRSHRRTWWSGWKMPKSFTSSSTSVTRSWSSRNPTLVTDADSSGGCRFQFICCPQIIRSHSHHSGLVMLITSLFQDQRGVSGAVHCERGNQVCSALLFWGRDWASQVEVWSGGWVSVFITPPPCLWCSSIMWCWSIQPTILRTLHLHFTAIPLTISGGIWLTWSSAARFRGSGTSSLPTMSARWITAGEPILQVQTPRDQTSANSKLSIWKHILCKGYLSTASSQKIWVHDLLLVTSQGELRQQMSYVLFMKGGEFDKVHCSVTC